MFLKFREDSLSAAVLNDPVENNPLEADALNNGPFLRLLVEPRPRNFLGDVAYVLRRKPPLPRGTDAAAFWPDVFVPSRVAWSSFVESLVYHALVLSAILTAAHWMPRHITQQDLWTEARPIFYPARAEAPKADLPKLDTGGAARHRAQQGDPVYARQPILSVPKEPDSRAQTLVTPPDVALHRDLPLPNIVAWNTLPSEPPPTLKVLASERRVLAPDVSVIAPPPQLDPAHAHRMTLPETAAVAPPPEIKDASRAHSQPALTAVAVAPAPHIDASLRHLGVINIGRTEIIAPSPQLPMNEQRTKTMTMTMNEAADRRSAAAQTLSATAIPPPPSISDTATAAPGRMIALGIHPVAPPEPLQPPTGNRRGEFSAAPQGSERGSGLSAIPEPAKTAEHDAGTGGTSTNPELPPGLRVEETPTLAASITIERHPIAAAPAIPAPRVGGATRQPAILSEHTPTDAEHRVFGTRRFYSMTLNMPNLNSARGSWILRFAELKEDPSHGELFSPLITRKSDPAYPSEMQRENIQGTVTLYAIIHSDGSVRDIRVLDGVDDQLDKFASEALARCKFEPALKDGAPIALEAVVMIPFRARW
jgi:TonB family protein